MKQFCEPYIDSVQEKIESMLNISTGTQSAAGLIEDTMRDLILDSCIKPLIYCLNIERLDENLEGGSAGERYRYFSEGKLCMNSVEKHFPLLTEQAANEIAPKIQYLLGVIEAYRAESPTLPAGLAEGKITDIHCAGDWHDNKSVVIISLSSGKQVVYKPTIGSNIALFQKIASLIFDETYASLYQHQKGAAGTWIKFIEHAFADSENECEKFYFNYGKIVFLSYALGINDLHHENMIACGVYPYVADLETIFSSFVNVKIKNYLNDSHRQVLEKLMFGTGASGLLPILSLNDYFGGDVSCLSNRALTVAADTIVDPYTDTMRIASEEQMVHYKSHLPREDINPLEYSEQICDGFRAAQRIFQEKHAEISAIISDCIDTVDCRVIINMTKAYAQIVRMKNEVRYRLDSQAYVELIDRLKIQSDFNNFVFMHEKDELLGGNIPKFYWDIEHSSIFCTRDNESKPVHNLPNVSRDDVLTTLEEQLAEPMIAEQLVQIENTVKTYRLMTDSQFAASVSAAPADAADDTHKSIFDISDDMTRNILSHCVFGNDGTISWIGMNVTANEELTYEVLNNTIYNGTIGIGFLFLELYKQSHDAACFDIISRIVTTLSLQFDTREFQVMTAGYYTGLTGIYAFLTDVESADIRIDDLTVLKDKVVKSIKKQIDETSVYDTLYGIHSAIVFFYNRYLTHADSTSIEILDLFHQRFRNGFAISEMGANAAASFAHGYSGMITGALCMYGYTQDGWYLDIAVKVQQLEDKLRTGTFDWIDIRDNDGQTISHFWCHGSCGIMISKLLRVHLNLLNFRDGSAAGAAFGSRDSNLRELSEYIDDILDMRYNTQNFTLCHGNYAFIDLIISFCKASQCELTSAMNRYINHTIRDSERQGFNCFIPGTVNSVGLFVGESGILLELMRFQNMDVASPLNLGCF